MGDLFPPMLVAEVGFEPHDLLGMNQASYHCSTPLRANCNPSAEHRARIRAQTKAISTASLSAPAAVMV